MLFFSIECNATTDREQKENDKKTINMCAKEDMTVDGIVRLSKIEVYPQYLDEYMKYAVEVGEISMRTEPGVLTMYALSEKDNPCRVTKYLKPIQAKRPTRNTLPPHTFKSTSRVLSKW